MLNEFDYESLLVRKEVFATIETDDKNHPVIIYNPTQEQRKLILDLIISNLNVGTDKLSTNITGFDIVFKVIPEITNIPLRFDEKNQEDIERVKRITENPSDLFLDVNTQINKIINRQFYRYYDNLKELANMPQELRDAYIARIDEAKSKENTELSAEEQRILELEEELNKLKAAKEGK